MCPCSWPCCCWLGCSALGPVRRHCALPWSESVSIRWFHYAAPQTFYGLAGSWLMPLVVLATALTALGLWMGFAVAPTDFQQGEGYRIIFVHVPASWMSMIIYLAMAFWSILGVTFNTRLSGMMTRALAPTGAMFAFLSLWTGALWGKPMWGTWWVWDARLTSELILFFLYLGYIALTSAIDDPRRGDRAGAVIAIVGAINVPIIYFSVKWWNTLHQGASVSLTKAPSMAALMLAAMLIMTLAFWVYTLALVLYRVRTLILQRESHTDWVREVVRAQHKEATA
ncbi:MAG: heme ABC transporter permease [Betaproteobacteria bacterium]|nr:heme ABC transporter permease [Betaproteobacteria bacterium]NBP43688.1 heme ABC transporter permease [Betaproteobacteria bacterium]